MAEIPRYRLDGLEGKLLTLHTLKSLGPCGNLQLIAFMAEHDLMNYFDLQAALYDLTRRGQVIREQVPGDDVYTITQEGEEALALFVTRLGESTLNKVDDAVPAFRERLRQERELFAHISHEGRNEYHTRVGISEGGMQLMQLDLSLPTADLAERFRANWAARARDIYDYIIANLSGEDLP